MGNCFGSQAYEESHDPGTTFVNPTSSLLFPPGTSRGYNNGGGISVSSSSADQSQVSSATTDVVTLKGEILPTPNLKEYTFAELKKATRNFNSGSIVGVGGFGTVYKGWVDERTLAPSKPTSGMIVAIKRLNKDSLQGHKEWQSEINFLGRLSHPHLVRLLGYCSDDEELLLVYAFVPKGSLDDHLFRRKSATEKLSWDVRLKIATGAARGLAFLHSSERSIINRDVKASNILLDEDYNAKIADFGLARLGPTGGESHALTRVVGTLGYAAPEYITTGHLNVKSDVYGFGVVLLELLTGLRAFDASRPSRQQSLVDWIQPKLSNKRKLMSFMDASLEGQYSPKAAYFAVQLTRKCLEIEPRKRPAMREVVEVLEQIQAIEEKSQQSKHGSSHSSSNRVGGSVGNRHHTSHSGLEFGAQRRPNQSRALAN